MINTASFMNFVYELPARPLSDLIKGNTSSLEYIELALWLHILAAEVLRRTRLAEAISSSHEVVLHSDNGSPIKGATMLAAMQKLGVVPHLADLQ